MRSSMRNRIGALFSVLLIAATIFAPAAVGALSALGSSAMFVIGDTSTTTDLDAAMKIIFEDTVVNNVVSDSELMSLFEEGGGIKTDTTTGGRYIETAQLFGLPAGVGFRPEGGYIPVPRGPTIENSRIYLKKIMASLEMTAEVLDRVRGSVGAYLDWGEEAFPTLLQRLTNVMDLTMLGYGSGIKARVNDGGPGTNLVVDSPFGIANLGDVEDALVMFMVNDQLRMGPNEDGTGLRVGTAIVEDVDYDNGYVEIDALPAGTVNNDYIFGGDSAGNDAGEAFMGLFGHVDDGGILATYQNIARADHSAWRGHVIDAATTFGAGTKLTERVISRADDLSYRRGGAKIDLFVCSRLGVEQLWDDMKGDRSLVDPRNYTGGRGLVSIVLGDRVIPIKVARKVPKSVAFGITRSTFKRYQTNTFEWERRTGAIWNLVTDATGRKHAFYAFGFSRLQIGGRDPQKNFRIENLATS